MIVLHLASQRYDLALFYHTDAASARSTCDLTDALGARTTIYQVDLKDQGSAQRTIDQVLEVYGQVEVLINNAGGSTSCLFLLQPQAAWWETFHNNIAPTINCSRFVLPQMIRARCGRIVNISSLSGLRGVPGQTAYSSAKAATILFTQALASEVGRYNVRVNCVAPGMVETELTRDLPSRITDRYVANNPQGRLGTPAEIATVVGFLVSDDSKHVNGEVIRVDGGSR